MAPMHAKNRMEALHELTVRSPGLSRFGPPEGGTLNKWRPTGGFMVPMHSEKRKRALHQPSPPTPLGIGADVRPRRRDRPRPRLSVFFSQLMGSLAGIARCGDNVPPMKPKPLTPGIIMKHVIR